MTAMTPQTNDRTGISPALAALRAATHALHADLDSRSPLTAAVIVLELSHSQDLAIPMLAVTLLAAGISGRIAPVSLYHALARQILDKVAPSRP